MQTVSYGNQTNEFVNLRDLIMDATAALCRYGILGRNLSKEVVVKEVSESVGLPLDNNSIGANIAFGTYQHYTPSA